MFPPRLQPEQTFRSDDECPNDAQDARRVMGKGRNEVWQHNDGNAAHKPDECLGVVHVVEESLDGVFAQCEQAVQQSQHISAPLWKVKVWHDHSTGERNARKWLRMGWEEKAGFHELVQTAVHSCLILSGSLPLFIRRRSGVTTVRRRLRVRRVRLSKSRITSCRKRSLLAFRVVSLERKAEAAYFRLNPFPLLGKSYWQNISVYDLPEAISFIVDRLMPVRLQISR